MIEFLGQYGSKKDRKLAPGETPRPKYTRFSIRDNEPFNYDCIGELQGAYGIKYDLCRSQTDKEDLFE